MNEISKRVTMTILGVLITGFTVGMFNFSDFGMDPFQVFAHGISIYIPLGYGTFYLLLNLIMLTFIAIIDKHKIGLGTFINVFLLGYVVQFSSWLFKVLIPTPTLELKILFLFIGIIIMCFGSSLYFIGNLGVSTYDAIALTLSERKISRFEYCRIGSDLVCILLGYLLGANAGIGTLITAFFMGPIISLFNRNVSIPLLYGKSNSKYRNNSAV